MGCAESVPINSLPPTVSQRKKAAESYLDYSAEDAKTDGEFWTCDKNTIVPVRFSNSGAASEKYCPAMTLPSIFKMAMERRGDKVALRVERGLPEYVKGQDVPPSEPLENWASWTWKEYYDETRDTARAFMGLGLEKLDAVNIYGFNSPEWYMSSLAATFAGGVGAGIYPTDTPEQVVFKAKHSDCAIFVAERMDKAAHVLEHLEELPKIKAIVIWGEGETVEEREESVGSEGRTVKILHWSNLKNYTKDVPMEKLEARTEALQPGGVATYIYTSGTTGNPKAVMISHDNIIWESKCILPLIQGVGDEDEEERIISYLPLSHVAGMMVDIVTPILITGTKSGWLSANFARPYDISASTVGDRLRCIKPTIFLGVPRVWEKIQAKIKAMSAAAPPVTGLKLKIKNNALAAGLEHQDNCQLGGTGAKACCYGLYEKKVHNVVRARLGLENCKFAFTGAAPIMKETLQFYARLGINVNEVYGMSENTGAVTWSTDAAHVWGSCGWEMPGCELRIFKVAEDGTKTACPAAKDLFNATEEEQGEICYRGRNIMMGYMANPALGEEHVEEIKKKNRAAIDSEGWLHSGDKGAMDERGMVKITGRYKELIIGAGGENIAPVPIEDAIKLACPAISNIIMIGDKKKFNIALVTLKAKGATGVLPGGEDLDGEAASLVDGVSTIPEAKKSKAFTDIILKAITDTNENGAVVTKRAAKIQKFAILDRDISVETDELTPTYKLKRSFTHTKYTEIIDKVYESSEAYVLV